MGIEEGMEKGILSVHKMIAAIIKIKFGHSGLGLIVRTKKIKDLPILEELAEKLSNTQDVREAETIFNELENETRNSPDR